MKWYAVCLALAATSSAFADRPDLNAFLNHSVHSTNELIEQIKRDPEVCCRYQRHFAMTQAQVIAYLHDLHLTRLKRSMVCNVYSVPPDGHVKMHVQELKAGLSVFADASETPILVVKCGNPINLGPRNRGEVSFGGPSSQPIGAQFSYTESATPQVDLAMTPPPVPEEAYVAPAIEATPVAVATYSHSSANYSWLAIIPVGAAIWGLTTIHSGGGNHTPTPTPTPVPEPATYALMGLGMGGLLLSKRKKSAK